jgi:predicted transcriptional regulator
MDEQATNPNLVDLTAAIVSAYVVKNSVRSGDLPNLIAEVHRALSSTHAVTNEPEPEPLNPAVNPKRSVFPDYIVCLEDGKKFKSIKRHLGVHHEMSPEEYRERWGLAHDYPMVAPNYAAARSALAKKMGLGQKGGRRKSKSIA